MKVPFYWNSSHRICLKIVKMEVNGKYFPMYFTIFFKIGITPLDNCFCPYPIKIHLWKPFHLTQIKSRTQKSWSKIVYGFCEFRYAFPHNNHCVKSVKMRSFFWSVFSRILTKYGKIQNISPYSARVRENTDQKKLRIWTHCTQWIFCQKEVKMLANLWKMRSESVQVLEEHISWHVCAGHSFPKIL